MSEDLRDFVHERFRRSDEKLDKALEILGDLRTSLAGVVQLLASHDSRLMRVEDRLDRIDKRLELYDPAIPS